MEPYQRLERDLSIWTNIPTVVCSSGTAALHLALECLDIPIGSRVIVPNYTMIACARAVTLAGMAPIFIDCNTSDYTIDTTILDSLMLKKDYANTIKAIMAVHVYNRVCDMNKISNFAMKHNLKVIEDCAEAHGIIPHIGTDAATWSFYKNKVVCGEEGGAIGFNHKGHIEKAKALRSLGFTEQHNYIHIPRGHNYRMSNVHAAMIGQSLARFNTNKEKRESTARMYQEILEDTVIHYTTENTKVSRWVYDIRINNLNQETQKSLIEELQVIHSAVRYGFKPMSYQKEYSGFYYHQSPYNVSENLTFKILSLPLVEVHREQIVEMSNIIRRYAFPDNYSTS